MAQQFRNVAVWLRVGVGATSIVYQPHGGGGPQFAAWNPAVAGVPEFGVQIGGPDSPVAGTLVGERYSRDLFQEGVREGLFPLAPTYVVTDRDDDLLKLVAVNGKPAWDELVAPVLKMAGITVDTGATGPKAPSGLGGPVQGGGAQGGPGTGPGDGGLISHPAPPPPPPTPVVTIPPVPLPPTPPAPAAGTGGFTPEERAALVQLVEHRFPGQGEKVASVVDLALAKDRQPLDIAKVLLPLLGVTDRRVLGAIEIAALFGA